jgi:hypothetical protein
MLEDDGTKKEMIVDITKNEDNKKVRRLLVLEDSNGRWECARSKQPSQDATGVIITTFSYKEL